MIYWDKPCVMQEVRLDDYCDPPFELKMNDAMNSSFPEFITTLPSGGQAGSILTCIGVVHRKQNSNISFTWMWSYIGLKFSWSCPEQSSGKYFQLPWSFYSMFQGKGGLQEILCKTVSPSYIHQSRGAYVNAVNIGISLSIPFT